MKITRLLAPREARNFFIVLTRALSRWRESKASLKHMGADQLVKHDRKALKAYLKSTTIARML